MQASATAPVSQPFTERNAALVPVWLLLTFNVYWAFWAYKTYREIRQHSPEATSITPGVAVGFLFIPFFNVFWFFRLMVDLPRALARVQAQCVPQAEALPRGRLSCLLIAGLVFNMLGGYVHPGMFVAGEVMLAAAFVIMQSWMNGHNRAHRGATVPPQSRETMAALLGAGSHAFDWIRASTFAAATLLGYLVINLGVRAALGGEFGLGAQWAISAISWALLMTAGGLLAFRFISSDWLASIVGAVVFAVGMNLVWLLTLKSSPTVSGVFGNFAGQFLWFAALALFLRVAQPFWLAVLLGSLVAEFGDSALNVLWTGETWWAGLAAWLNAEPGSAIYTMARLQMAQPLLDLFSAVVFTGVIVAGRVAWPRRPA